jgi:uncharacterized NAD-dependent epimerase/dehydratase family protein
LAAPSERVGYEGELGTKGGRTPDESDAGPDQSDPSVPSSVPSLSEQPLMHGCRDLSRRGLRRGGSEVAEPKLHERLHDLTICVTGKMVGAQVTGIMISGEGVPIDCVVADFVNGAAEELVAANEQHDYLLVEGQGSISHPAYSAVTLGLLHGCAPDGLIFCYEAGRKQVKGFDNIDIPPMIEQMKACEMMANLRHPCKIIGIAINTRTMNQADALAEIARTEATYGLPTCDVYRTGADKLVKACVALREELVSK